MDINQESHPQLERSNVTDANLFFTLYKDARGLTSQHGSEVPLQREISPVNFNKKNGGKEEHGFVIVQKLLQNNPVSGVDI